MRGLLITVAVLALVWFGGHWLLADHPSPPTYDQLMQAAHKEFSGEYCHLTSRDQHWPCVRVTNFDFLPNESNLRTPTDKKSDGYRVCFDLSMEVETTRWDPIQNIPSEPRTFAQLPAPKHVCYLASNAGGATDWEVIPPGNREWWQPLTEQIWRAECRLGPCDDA